MTTAETMTMDVDLLRTHSDGALLFEGDDGWDDARQAYNLLIDQRPAAIALPENEQDVALAIRFAAAYGLAVAPQRSGHNAGALGPLDDALLVRTDRMQGVELDPVARRARVRAGAKWENVVPLASELGLAALHGSSPDVGVVGYSLGGGMGWYARKHGLAANSVTAIELVTADGRLRRVDHDNEPELFWALRGGGGSFGVVTALEFELYAIREVYAGALFFPWERAGEVLHAWREWLPGTPDEVTSVGRLLQVPDWPELPEPLRGKSFALVEAAFLGDDADGVELMRPLRDLGPAIDTFAIVPPVGLGELHMDPPDPIPHVSEHRLLGPLPAQAIDELVAVAGAGSGSPLASVELRQLGGALGRSGPHHGAVARLAGEFAMFASGLAYDDESEAANRAHAALVSDALSPYDAGRYLNFTAEAGGAARFFPEETLRRLQAVKAEYDPDDLFRSNHPI